MLTSPKFAVITYFCVCFFWLGCSTDDPSSTETPCVDDSKACGKACDDDQACGAALYCAASGKCAKACDDDHACMKGQLCTPRSECVDEDDFGGTSPEAGLISGGGMIDDEDSGVVGPTKPDVCLDVEVQARRVTPTVILIVDRSGSMTEPFDMGTRWDVLRSFLLDDTGLIADLQSQVRFGLSMYSATHLSDADIHTPLGECPQVEAVGAKLDNYDEIKTVYEAAEPIQETPTGDSINKILEDLNLPTNPAPDEEREPIAFIVATDGEPDSCEDLNPDTDPLKDAARLEAVTAVKDAFKAEIRTFMISVGTGTVSAMHLQDMANAGLGKQAGDSDAEYWVAGDDATLRQALQDIIGSQLSCKVKLDGKVDKADACLGTVMLGSTPLKCNDKNGWKLLDSTHIEVVGTACTTLKEKKDASLHVTFPCDVPILF